MNAVVLNSLLSNLKVAGTSFRSAEEQTALASLSGCQKVPVRLEPEPTNQFDPNAIKVYLRDEGNWICAGYIPKEIAAELKGVAVAATARVETFDSKRNPGTKHISIMLNPVETEPDANMADGNPADYGD